jgi:hypothetical protein
MLVIHWAVVLLMFKNIPPHEPIYVATLPDRPGVFTPSARPPICFLKVEGGSNDFFGFKMGEV